MKTTRNAIATVSVLISVLLSAPAQAATVTSNADSGLGSLRQAIAGAVPGETIVFSGVSTITLTSGELLIGKNLTISGPGTSNLTIRRDTAGGTPDFRIFNVLAGATVTISGLTVSNGRAAFGGGIHSQGALTLIGCMIVGNSATEKGGGIANDGGLVTMSNCVISGNSVQAAAGGSALGGGLFNDGTMTANNCAVSGNSVQAAAGGSALGGGLFNDGTLTADRWTVSNNSAQAGAGADCSGGGVYNTGTLKFTNASGISGNSATGGAGGAGGGGGISNNLGGTVLVENSTVGSNTATGGAGGSPGAGHGGGIANSLATVTLDRSTVSGNLAVGGAGGGGGQSAGGGISNDSGTVFVENSTVSGNVLRGGAGSGGGAGQAHGGGVFNLTASLVLTHSTIAANVIPGAFPDDGGGVFNSDSEVVIKNTIVAANTSTVDLSNSASGLFTSGGFNLIGATFGPITPGPSDRFNITPTELKLGPLQNNGGPTFTHALLCGSPAIDKGDNTDAPATDQRGFARIVPAGGTIDIGAYEYKNTAPAITTCPAPITLSCDSSSCQATLSVGVFDADGDPLTVAWTVDGRLAQTTVVATGPATFTALFAVGTHQVTVSVSDPSVCSVSCSTTVVVGPVTTATPCPAGDFRFSVDGNGDLNIKYDQFPAPNDNSYGVNAVGWRHGHRFSSLVHSDKAGFQLRDPKGVVKLSFDIDYLTATTVTPATPSGYKSLGPFGGDGSVVVGTLTPADITWDTSLARNLNTLGYCTAGNCTTGGVNLLVDSPPTNATHTNYVISNPALLRWDFHDTYFVTIKAAKLASIGFNKDTWKVEPNLAALHNSPPKPCPTPSTGKCQLKVRVKKSCIREIQITIANESGATDAILTALHLSWPQANGKLIQVKLDGDVVYDTPDIIWSAAGVTLGEGGSQPLVSNLGRRTIRKGSSDVLILVFEKQVVTDLSKYQVTTSFGAGCDLQVLP